MKKERKPKKQRPISRMLANVREKDSKIFALCALYSIIALLVPLFTVMLPKVLIGYLTSDAPTLYGIVIISAALFVFGAAAYFLKQYIHSVCYPRITALRLGYLDRLSEKLLSMDYKYMESPTFFDEHDTAFQSTSNNDNGVEGIYHKLFEMPLLLLTAAGLAVFIGMKNYIVLIALFVHIIATACVSLAVQRNNYKLRADLARHERRVRYYSNTSKDFTYGKDLRLYDLRERVLDHFKLEIRGYTDVLKAMANREYGLGFITLLTLLVSDLATYGILTYLTVKGMPIADYSMYVIAATTLSATMTQLSDNITHITREHMYVRDLFGFLDGSFESSQGTLEAPPIDKPVEIEFEHVTFAYPGTDKNIYTDFSLKIPAGQKLALIGVNGAGKSTLIKLLTGLYTPDSGRILISGHDVREYSRTALISVFAPVFQDVNLMAFTVAENIAGTRERIDLERVNEALRKAGLYDKIDALPEKTETLMLKIIDENGLMLSGGEAQKLAIARALYKGGSCVIMDEPTSALDALAEAEIYAQFGELTHGKTAIFVSHRLASTRFCDEIALIDNDGIREYGTHEELMDKRGLYYEMFMTQGKYYREDEEEEVNE